MSEHLGVQQAAAQLEAKLMEVGFSAAALQCVQLKPYMALSLVNATSSKNCIVACAPLLVE